MLVYKNPNNLSNNEVQGLLSQYDRWLLRNPSIPICECNQEKKKEKKNSQEGMLPFYELPNPWNSETGSWRSTCLQNGGRSHK